MPAKIASGMDVITTMVLRQLPRNSSTISDTSSDAITASLATLWIAERTYTDWSKSRLMSTSGGAALRMSGSKARVESTTSRLDASECLRMVR